MVQGRAARHQKKVSEEKATLVLIDEACFQLLPVRKRTLAPRGETPRLKAWDRRSKFSAISAIMISRTCHRPGLLFTILPQGENFTSDRVAIFLRKIRRRIPGPIHIIWDRANIHRGPEVRKFLARAKGIQTHHFPAYAPETNPVEGIWGHAKYHQMPNLVVPGATELSIAAETSLNEISRRPVLLSAFIQHAWGPAA
ncbi:MAG TPA: IS630 family transposase [Candidatus Ozemobacteraceae bacterium]|nr:IS630 family transposase [Candidatus Ozemobacteraceae bacterium]